MTLGGEKNSVARVRELRGFRNGEIVPSAFDAAPRRDVRLMVEFRDHDFNELSDAA